MGLLTDVLKTVNDKLQEFNENIEQEAREARLEREREEEAERERFSSLPARERFRIKRDERLPIYTEEFIKRLLENPNEEEELGECLVGESSTCVASYPIAHTMWSVIKDVFVSDGFKSYDLSEEKRDVLNGEKVQDVLHNAESVFKETFFWYRQNEDVSVRNSSSDLDYYEEILDLKQVKISDLEKQGIELSVSDESHVEFQAEQEIIRKDRIELYRDDLKKDYYKVFDELEKVLEKEGFFD